MSDTEFIVSLIVGAAVPIAVALLLSRGKRRVEAAPFTGEIRLRYNRGIKAFAIFGALFIPFMLWVAYTHSGFSREWTPSSLLSMFFSLLFLVLGVTALIIETFGVEYRITKLGLMKHTPWSSDFYVLWSEILSIGHSRFGDWYTIKTKKGNIRINSQFIDGIENLRLAAMQNVPREKLVMTSGDRWT